MALRRALQLLSGWARGPARGIAAKMLVESCEALWNAGGRRQCEALSATGRPCMLKAGHAEKHRGEHIFLQAVASGSIQKVLLAIKVIIRSVAMTLPQRNPKGHFKEPLVLRFPYYIWN